MTLSSRSVPAPEHGRVVERSGEYNRLAEPGWADPLDSSFSEVNGGRWNPPGSFPVLYLNDTITTARLQVLHKLRGLPYGPEDLNPDQQHDLVAVQVPRDSYLDCVSDQGLAELELPATWPRHRNRRPVTHATCQPIGLQAHEDGLPGIACRSAAAGAAPANEELAFFDRPRRRPRLVSRTPFERWWWEARPGPTKSVT